MVFNAFWTILLGVIGGIISSLIVSRVLYIISKHQEETTFINHIVRRIVDISVLLNRARAIFDRSYYEDIGMAQEMKKKGYKTEMEYYLAHNDIESISIINTLKEEIDQIARSIQSAIDNRFIYIKEEKLKDYLRDILAYTHEVIEVQGFSNSSIDEFKKRKNGLQDDYYDCIPLSGGTLAKLILKDKCMIVLLCGLAVLIIGTVVTKLLGV